MTFYDRDNYQNDRTNYLESDFQLIFRTDYVRYIEKEEYVLT